VIGDRYSVVERAGRPIPETRSRKPNNWRRACLTGEVRRLASLKSGRRAEIFALKGTTMSHATSANGLALIQAHEGFHAEPTRLPDGTWVVGYSHVRVGEPGEPVNENEAAELLAFDVAPFEKLVNARVSNTLNQAQFDALVSFAFSVGPEAFEQSQVLRRVNSGDFVAAACAMDAWRKADVGGETIVIDSLVRRRAAEKALFLRDMAQNAAPSVFMRAKLDYAASVLGAPVKYAPPPEVKDAPAPLPQVAPALRITEILKSEPATETLLLTQVVANDFVAEDEESEIVTAHAKPVARSLDHVREATRVAFEAAKAKRREHKRFVFFKHERSNQFEPAPHDIQVDRRLRTLRAAGDQPRKELPDWTPSVETIGLIALFLFGLGLMALGGSLLADGVGDLVSLAAGSAVLTPGLAAALMAVAGLWRSHAQTSAA
jgi:lysozyme